MKKIFIIGILLSFFLSAELNAQTKNDPIEAGDSIESLFKTEDDMKPLIAKAEPFTISYGGWISTAIIDDRSGSYGTSTEIMSSISTAKVWLKTTLPLNSYIYLRGMDRYTYYIEKPDGADLDNENDIDLDAGYFSMSVLNNRIDYSLGRKFILLGSGILFSGRGDGGDLNIYSKYIDLMLFGAYTGLLSKESNPYRLSSNLAPEGTDEGKRVFMGGSLSRTIYNQTIYLLALYQLDKNDDIDKVTYPNAKGDYNSQYYGLGLKGVFKNASYFGEFIIERGESYTKVNRDNPTVANEKKDIKASAAVFSLNYYFTVKTRPALLVQYAYGSGDSDKDTSPSSTTGNGKGDDKGFMYFGNFSGGYALRPYLSNIHIYRAGVSVSPLIDSNTALWLKRMNISIVYSNYQKDVSNSTINAGEAGKSKKDIGHGFDLGLTWQIFSDLSFFGNFGLFLPGSAYESNEKNRTFVMAGINLSF